LDPTAKLAYPWYRVVGGDGTLGVVKRGPDGVTQAELLADEGVQVVGNAVWPDLETHLVPAERLAHGLARQRRPR